MNMHVLLGQESLCFEDRVVRSHGVFPQLWQIILLLLQYIVHVMTQNMEDGKQKNIVQVYVLLAVAEDPIRHSSSLRLGWY